MVDIPHDIILAAQASQARYYVPSSVSIAQWALESSWGAHQPVGSNNPFGIKAKADQPYVSASTWEVEGGVDVRVTQKFAKYASVADAFEAHAHLLATVSLYKPAMDAWYKARDLATGVALMAQHYATDPSYATKVMSIIKAHDLVAYDSLPQDAKRAIPTTPIASKAPPADPISVITDTIGSVIGAAAETIAPASGPSSAPAVPKSPTTSGNNIMDLLPILAGLFSGVAGKIGVAGTVVSAVPTIVEGTIENISEAPKAIADIEKLVADIHAGKWGDTPDDVKALVAEFGVILKNYGVNLPALTNMVAALPAQPAITAAAKA